MSKEKNNVIDVADMVTQAEKIRRDIDKEYLPNIRDNAKLFKGVTLNSGYAQKVTNVLVSSGVKDRVNLFEYMERSMFGLDNSFSWAKAVVEDIPSSRVLSSNLEIRYMVAFRIITNTSGVLDTFLRLSVNLIKAETALLRNEPEPDISVDELNKLIGIFSYINTVNAKTTILDKGELKDIPNIFVDMSEGITADLKSHINLGDMAILTYLVRGISKIFYNITRTVNEYRMTKLKLAKEQHELLTYRVLAYKKAQEGEYDAELDEIIARYEDEIDTLTYKINKLEKKLKGE